MIVWIWWIYIIASRELKCSVETIPPNYPTRAQIIEACEFDPYPGIFKGMYRVQKFEITRASAPPTFCAPPAVPVGDGLLNSPANPIGLYTQNDYGLLSHELLWHARAEPVAEWQNLFNPSIYTAASAEGIPANLLKRVIGLESQFWVLWHPPAGEVGLMQVTDAGADVLMRYDPAIFKQNCPDAIFNCKDGYHILTEREQRAVRDVFRAGLVCQGCTIDQAIAHERGNMIIYARLLRAYGCRNGWNWRDAMLDYNGSTEYLNKLGL